MCNHYGPRIMKCNEMASMCMGSIKNPWNHLTKSSYHVAVCNEEEILYFNNAIKNADDKFHLEL